MLWTDADFVSLADLESVDPDVTSVAESLELTFTGDNGILRRGIEEAGRKFQNQLVTFTTYLSSNDLSANHMAAVFYTGSAPNQRLRASLDQVVVTGRNAAYWSDVKTWAVNQVLMRFYLSASNKSSDDRYSKKRDMFIERDRFELFPSMKQSGVPIVYKPMTTPAASQLLNPGSWSASMTSQVGATAVGSYDVALTYVDQSGNPYMYNGPAQPNNAESHPSAPQNVTLTAGHVITVDATLLNPPTGSFPREILARGWVLTLNATGWNVYVGQTGQTLYLQNATPIPIGTRTYQLAGDPTAAAGMAAGLGQYPESYLTAPNLIKRG